MTKFAAIIWGILWRVAAFSCVIFAGLWWMNRSSSWDASQALATADTKVSGRVGVAVVVLAMPERYDPIFFENFLDKLFNGTIPWPINVLAGADAGTALIDPSQSTMATRYEPKVLADIWGRTHDVDGVPWIEKYKRGQVRFVKPSGNVAHDHGFFLYPERKGGIRTVTAKLLLKARYTMYAALPNGYLPHYSQTIAMAEAALSSLRTRHTIAAGAVVDAFDPWKMESSVRSILDQGVDTLVLSSVAPIYSDFEEMKGSFSKVYKVVKAWEKEHPGKSVKIVVAPYLASAPSFDTLWIKHLEATAPAAKMPGQSKVRVIVGLHGLPVSLVNTDSWTPRSIAVVNRLRPKIEAAMRAKGYGIVEVIYASEGFSDLPEDKKNQLVSVSEEFHRAVKDDYEVVISLPVEFLAENTDMLFTHAATMFEDLPGYRSYQGPPADVDWSKPYVRRFFKGKTEVIYSGAPGGAATTEAGGVLADAVSTLWAKP
jgi:protoheme ferro-lyase